MIIANLPHIIVGVIILFWTYTFVYKYTRNTPLETMANIIVGVILLFWTFTFIYMYSQRTPLEKMAKTGHLDALKKNLKIQDINKIFPKSGLTLMMTAAFYGQTEVVEYLLKNGANVHIASRDLNQTAMHCAAYGNNVDIIKLLKFYRADINARDKNGQTPLMYAIMSEERYLEKFEEKETIKFIIKNEDTKLDIQDKEGCTALGYALATGQMDVKDFLLSKGVSKIIKEPSAENLTDY